MSSVSDEHIVNNLSNYELLESYSLNHNHDLVNRIMLIVNERLDDAQQCKNTFNKSSMQPAFYQVLCEIKDRIGKNLDTLNPLHSFILALNTRQMSSIDDQPSDQLNRLDNMLIAEGISERCSSIITNTDQNHSDYQTKLAQIRQTYNLELEKYENHCNDFCLHVRALLREQSQIRPMNERDIERLVMIIRKKFSTIQIQLKQSTCEAVMILRSRFLDAR
jgi:hypothetical protein